MGSNRSKRTDRHDAGPADSGRQQQEVEQGSTEQQQDEELEQHRRRPSDEERQVRRRQGGHDRPVGDDHVPHRRPQAVPRDGRA